MKLHQFFAKYANIPLSGENNRFIKHKYLSLYYAPDDLYCEIRKCQQEIDESQRRIETLLEVADNIM